MQAVEFWPLALANLHDSSVTDLLEASNVLGAGYGQTDWLRKPAQAVHRHAPRCAIKRRRPSSSCHRRKLAEKAEQGDIQAIREIGDRLDGKAVQAIERGDAPIEAMTDQQLMAIIRGGSREPLIEPAQICGSVQAK
jgi:hypothetical protein